MNSRPLAFPALVLVLALGACGASRALPEAAAGTSGAAAGNRSTAGASGHAGNAADSPAGGPPPVPCSASAPPLGPATLPPATVGKPYLQVLTISGADASQLHWAITGGQLPSGLSLVPTADTTTNRPPQAHAELRGTPQMAGKFDFTLQASILGTFPCGAAPAIRSYVLEVTGDPEVDAGGV